LILPEPPSIATGVGQDEAPLPQVRRTNGASRKYIRLAGVLRACQISLHEVECQLDEPSNIFDKDPSGSASLHNGKSVRPEVTVICRASSFARLAEGLTRYTSGHKVNGSKCSKDVEMLMSNLSNVVVSGNICPVLR
jgi:hypothetical protein